VRCCRLDAGLTHRKMRCSSHSSRMCLYQYLRRLCKLRNATRAIMLIVITYTRCLKRSQKIDAGCRADPPRGVTPSYGGLYSSRPAMATPENPKGYTYWKRSSPDAHLLPDCKPQRIERPVEQQAGNAQSSAWNAAGTWEERKLPKVGGESWLWRSRQ